MSETLYKVLADDGSARMGRGKWPLPKRGKPGAWRAVRGALVPCERGLHLCRRGDLIHWLGPAIFVAEWDGDRLDCDDKIVVRKARLVRRINRWTSGTARLFAHDCVQHALLFVNSPSLHRLAALLSTARRVPVWADAVWNNAWDVAAWEIVAVNHTTYGEERAWQTERLHAYLDGSLS